MTDDKQTYLGDALYASFDGYQIWLAANHPDNKTVAIEPQVFAQLMHFAQKVWGGIPGSYPA